MDEIEVTGWVAGEPDAKSLTVAGLIQELQAHIAIDPARANHPVQIVAAGKRPRLVPGVTASTGNSDPELGGRERVMIYCLTSI